MSRILAVDPGYQESAYVVFDGRLVTDHGIVTNEALRASLSRMAVDVDAVVFEQIEAMGMAVGREVFETVFWTGRFFELVNGLCPVAARMPRRAVKLHLCNSARAQDTNIRVALIDRFGGSKAAAIGVKKAPGPLYSIKSHEFAALAIAVTWFDLHQSAAKTA